MADNTFEASASSTAANAKNLVQKSLGFIAENNRSLSCEIEHDLKLVLSELLYNAVIHGNNSDECKNIHISVDLFEDRLCVKVSDEGCGFDFESIIGKKSSLETDVLMAENGRGILLVNALVDELSFLDEGRTIEFVKRVI